MICSACNHAFEESESVSACGACVTRGKCGLVKCPKCGYESAREPRLVQQIKNFFNGRKSPSATVENALPTTGTLSLADLQEGDSAEIESFVDLLKMRKFLSMGILPGTTVTVIKRSPVVVVKSGYSEFAFDKSLAGAVRVLLLRRT